MCFIVIEVCVRWYENCIVLIVDYFCEDWEGIGEFGALEALMRIQPLKARSLL